MQKVNVLIRVVLSFVAPRDIIQMVHFENFQNTSACILQAKSSV